MRNRQTKFGLGIAIATLCLGVGVAAFERQYFRPNRSFDPIIYKSRDGLCSVQPSGDVSAYCPGIFFEHPAISPDGNLIAAVERISSQGGPAANTRLVVADRRGVVVQSIASSDGFIRPVWAPDGQYLYAINYELRGAIGRWAWPSNKRIAIPIRDLDRGCNSIQGISFSASGHRAALLCDFRRIYIAATGSIDIQIQRLLSLSFTNVGFASWLSDDQLMTVARMEKGRAAKLWRIDVNTAATHAIDTPVLSFRDYVSVSPDKKSAVATARQLESNEWSLWRIDFDRLRTTRLTHGSEDVSPTWAH